ncbi:MAG: hypothetical protein MUQ32_03695 [Chloroflexi bacterium]|nr:hypothetical protein [Chloroflexota bacterium]
MHDAASDTLSLHSGAGDAVIDMVTTSLHDVLDHVLAVHAGRSRDRAARAAHLL